MIDALYLSQAAIVAAAAGAATAALPEARGRPVRRWQFLLPAGLAALAFVLEIVHPSLEELKEPAIWLFAVVAGVAGVARGRFMPLEVDQTWNRIRLPRAPEGLWFAVALALLATVEAIEVSQAAPDARDLAFRPLVEFGMALAAGFLVGRAGAAWIRVPHIPHSDLP